tara:strand:+ start:913 stop:1485 length:573 start_codon:yes stop_codon:yes gene_type:complete
VSEQFYIGFGSGIKLLSEDWYIKEFGGKISKKAFRSFCRALKVPIIEIGKNGYVEMNSFQIAMKAITRIGRDDFFVSGCRSVATGKQRPSELEDDYVSKNLEPLICELLACKTLGGLSMTTETKNAAKNAAERMARAGLAAMVQNEQEKHTRRSIRVYGDINSLPRSIMEDYEEKLDEESDTGNDPESNS